MTEKEFIELFGDKNEQYIKIGDLKNILVNGKILVYDFLIQHKSEIWGPKDQTYFCTLNAFSKIFDEWEETLTFEKLIKDFKKLTYLKGVGKLTLQHIASLCILSGQKISGEMQRYNK